MYRTLDFHTSDSTGRVIVTDEDGEEVALLTGGISNVTEETAEELAARFNCVAALHALLDGVLEHPALTAIGDLDLSTNENIRRIIKFYRTGN